MLEQRPRTYWWPGCSRSPSSITTQCRRHPGRGALGTCLYCTSWHRRREQSSWTFQSSSSRWQRAWPRTRSSRCCISQTGTECREHRRLRSPARLHSCHCCSSLSQSTAGRWCPCMSLPWRRTGGSSCSRSSSSTPRCLSSSLRWPCAPRTPIESCRIARSCSSRENDTRGPATTPLPNSAALTHWDTRTGSYIFRWGDCKLGSRSCAPCTGSRHSDRTSSRRRSLKTVCPCHRCFLRSARLCTGKSPSHSSPLRTGCRVCTASQTGCPHCKCQWHRCPGTARRCSPSSCPP